MAGEINSTNVLIEDGTGALIGQMETTVSYGGTPIDITNKSSGGFITVMDGERAGKQVTLAGSIVYNNSTGFKALKAANDTGDLVAMTVTFTSGDSTDESVTGNFSVSGWADALPVDDKASSTFTLNSSGTYTRTAAVT